MPNDFEIETSGFQHAALQLAHMDAAVSRAVYATLAETAAPFVREMQAKAAQVSPKVARVIGANAQVGGGNARLAFVARGSQMPAGHQAFPRALEGREGQAVFKHPVFGNRKVWVTQPTHPFMRPVLRGKRELIALRLKSALERATKL